jgi:hypothetical protein
MRHHEVPGGVVRSRRLALRLGAGASLLAAVAAAVEVPGIGKWIATAALTGLATAVSGLVTRSADQAVARGREVALDPAPPAPIYATGRQLPGRGVDTGHVGPIPDDVNARPANTVDLWRTSVYVAVEAAVDRAVILTGLSMQIESRSTPPAVQISPRRRPRGRPRRTFDVQLSDANPPELFLNDKIDGRPGRGLTVSLAQLPRQVAAFAPRRRS